jgi:hypothetical protein
MEPHKGSFFPVQRPGQGLEPGLDCRGVPLVSRSMRNPRRAARIISETSSLRCSSQSGGQTDSSSSAGMYCCEALSPRPGVPVGVVPHQTGRLVKDRWLLAGQGGPDGAHPGRQRLRLRHVSRSQRAGNAPLAQLPDGLPEQVVGPSKW